MASHASAADLPNRQIAPVFDPPVVPASWSGCFVGGFGALDIAHVHDTSFATIGGNARSAASFVAPPTQAVTFFFNPATGRFGRRTTTTYRRSSIVQVEGIDGLATTSYGRTFVGGSGGARIGCNYQTGRVVLGAQLEAGYLGIGGSVLDPNQRFVVSSLNGGFYAAVSGRLGYALGARTLLFVRGGVGYADLRYATYDAGLGTLATAHGSPAIPLVGAGLEYRLTRNISLTGEYTYFHGGCRTTSAAFAGLVRGVQGTPVTVAGSAGTSNCFDDHVVAFGLNYYFDPPTRVVARY